MSESNSVVYLDKGLFARRDPLTLLRFAYAVDPVEFKKRFMESGVNVRDESDIYALAELANSGGDKMGVLKINKNKPLVFSVMDTFSRINLSNQEIINAANKVKIV